MLCDDNDLVPCLVAEDPKQLKLSCPDLWAMRSSLNAGKNTSYVSGRTGSDDARLLAARQVAGRQLGFRLSSSIPR
jgi:hypothetical protein